MQNVHKPLRLTFDMYLFNSFRFIKSGKIFLQDLENTNE